MTNLWIQRPSWTSCILHTALACVCLLGVFYFEQKYLVVLYSALGTISIARAVRLCPIRLETHVPLVIGTALLGWSVFFVWTAWGHYDHGVKVIIIVALFMWVPYLLWEYLTRLRARSGSASS